MLDQLLHGSLPQFSVLQLFSQVLLKPFCSVGPRSFQGWMAEMLITGSQPSWKAGMGWPQPEAHVPSHVCRAAMLTATCV